MRLAKVTTIKTDSSIFTGSDECGDVYIENITLHQAFVSLNREFKGISMKENSRNMEIARIKDKSIFADEELHCTTDLGESLLCAKAIVMLHNSRLIAIGRRKQLKIF